MRQITDCTRGYDSYEERERAIDDLIKDGYNHFTKYRDKQSPYALMYFKADHKFNSGRVYINH